MRLSAFTVVDSYAERPESDERLTEVVRLARTAEESGLDALWVAEHHFHHGGVCPSPPVLLAACGAVTRTLRLGSMVSVLPFHRAIDVAEEYATVDRLTGGRLNFGVGSGYLAGEFEGFGVDPATKRDRFEAALELVRAAWAGEAVRAAGPDAPTVHLNVRPVQRPHPPIWVAVQRREAIAHVARRGLSVGLIPYATVNGLEELADEVREYKSHLAPGVRGEVAVALHLYAGPEVARARTALRRYVESRHQTGSTFLQAKAARDPAAATPEGIERNGLAVFGAPEDVTHRLRAFEAMGVDELLGIFDFGALPEADAAASVRAVGRAWAASRRAPMSERI
jgi:alkanesulfonate monooxygenase SsuD/methylene tetrahydromethanopterin reductase-like flavin-dependent oxidoreductase (luciferase family)